MSAVLEEYPLDGDTIVGPEKFWLVTCTDARQIGGYRDGHQLLTRSYKYVHETQSSAEREALRLANKYRGYSFAVVESVAVVTFREERGMCVWEDSEIEPRKRPPFVAHLSVTQRNISIGNKHG